MALIGTMVRWYESHLIGADIGHIPVSNLYEVFVLFCWLTTAFYLYFEEQYEHARAGRLRDAGGQRRGRLPALVHAWCARRTRSSRWCRRCKSWWMKLHVPANFIGYGTFALSAMVAFAYLIKQQAAETRWYKLAPLWLLGVVLCFVPVVFRQRGAGGGRQLLGGLLRRSRR